MKRIINYIHYISQVKMLFFSLIAVSIIISAGIGGNAFLLKILYDSIFIKLNETLLYKVNILIFLSIIIISIFKIIKEILISKIRQILTEKTRESLTDELVRYTYQYFVEKNSSEIFAHLLEDSECIGRGFVRIFIGISNLIIISIWLILFFILIKWFFFIYLISTILIVVWLLIWIKPIAISNIKTTLTCRELYKFFFKVISCIKVIKYELINNRIINELKVILKKINKNIYINSILHGFLYNMYDPIFYILNILLIFFGANEINKGNFTIGFFTVILILLWTILEPLIEVNLVLLSYKELHSAFNRISEYKTGMIETGGNIEFQGIKDEIRFSNIYFKYPKNNFSLNNINLRIKKGEKIAIAGKTGSGKSTIINLLLRLHQPDKGNIYLDNKDISSFTIDSIREKIIIVPQEVFLYPTTFRKNIDIKDNLTDDEIYNLVDKLHLNIFLSKLPKGMDTIIYDNAIGLSGGEKQRIGIARALSLKANIYIFDEITANLDPKTARSIIGYINSLPIDITKIFITHDLNMAINMEKIFVLSNNAFVELNNLDRTIEKKRILEIIS